MSFDAFSFRIPQILWVFSRFCQTLVLARIMFEKPVFKCALCKSAAIDFVTGDALLKLHQYINPFPRQYSS